MHASLILVHVVTMVASLIIMPSAVLLAMRGVRLSVSLATVGFVMTGIGFMTGVILLLHNPLLSQCVILAAYLLATIAVYGAGFSWGVASRARLLVKA